MGSRDSGPIAREENTMSFDLLPGTLDELWAIHDYVRQHDKLGQEWDKDLTVRIMAAIRK